MVSLLVLLSACASANQSMDKDAAINDPAEGFNRATFEMNYFIDGLILKPVGSLYRDLPPPAVRESFDNFLQNLDTPLTFANTVLQGNVNAAKNSFMRFLINSTVGVFGLIDVATDWGFPYQEEDFGQTLAVWGVAEGPYTVLPVLGPSNTRDSIGKLADLFMDPFRYVVKVRNGEDDLYLARNVSDSISARAKLVGPLEDIEQGSVDFYASLRSLYKQRRDYLIENKDFHNPKSDNGVDPNADKPQTSPVKKIKKSSVESPLLNLQLSQNGESIIFDQIQLPESTPTKTRIE